MMKKWEKEIHAKWTKKIAPSEKNEMEHVRTRRARIVEAILAHHT